MSPRHEVIEARPISADDITTLRRIPESHKAFMARFLPEIHQANNNILIQRNSILGLLDSLEDHSIGHPAYFRRLNGYLIKFRLDTLDPDTIVDPEMLKGTLGRLLKRADIIPTELVMAQAIIESGWGRSNFARKGNNYFGMRCYTENCGTRPAANDSSGFFIKVYASEMEGIEDYLRTLNTGYAYKDFRQLRFELRSHERPMDPVLLANGLLRYSENGDDYIRMVSNIIMNYIPHDVGALLTGRELLRSSSRNPLQ